MNWFSSIKDKVTSNAPSFSQITQTSTSLLGAVKSKSSSLIQTVQSQSSDIVSTYKYGLKSFIDNIKGEDEEQIEQQQSIKINSEHKNVVSKPEQMKELYLVLLQFFEKKQLQKITIKQLNNIIHNIKEKQDFLTQDPNDLILLQREDFTNFMSFLKKYRNNKSLMEKIFRYDTQFPQEIMEQLQIQIKGQKQNLNRILLRFLTEELDKKQNPTKVNNKKENKLPEENIQEKQEEELKVDSQKHLIVEESTQSDELQKMKEEMEKIKTNALQKKQESKIGNELQKMKEEMEKIKIDALNKKQEIQENEKIKTDALQEKQENQQQIDSFEHLTDEKNSQKEDELEEDSDSFDLENEIDDYLNEQKN